jgi:hypothetical protein
VTYVIDPGKIKAYHSRHGEQYTGKKTETDVLREGKERIYIQRGGVMIVLIAFLAGFYFGVFTISLMVAAGRRKMQRKKRQKYI